MMMINKRHTKIALAICVAGFSGISAGISGSVYAHDHSGDNKAPQVLKSTPQDIKAKAETKIKAKATDFTPDPAKRLSLKSFVKGGKKLHEYLKNAVEKASPEDKKFLSKEKQQMELQIAHPKAAYDQLFASIEANTKRLEALKIFPAPLVAQMNQHFLETEAGKAVGLLNNESKRKDINDDYRGEIEYQQGIIARRDQVNYKSTLRNFKNAVKYSPNNVDYLTALADIYQRLDDNEAATKVFAQLKMAQKK